MKPGDKVRFLEEDRIGVFQGFADYGAAKVLWEGDDRLWRHTPEYLVLVPGPPREAVLGDLNDWADSRPETWPVQHDKYMRNLRAAMRRDERERLAAEILNKAFAPQVGDLVTFDPEDPRPANRGIVLSISGNTAVVRFEAGYGSDENGYDINLAMLTVLIRAQKPKEPSTTFAIGQSVYWHDRQSWPSAGTVVEIVGDDVCGDVYLVYWHTNGDFRMRHQASALRSVFDELSRTPDKSHLSPLTDKGNISAPQMSTVAGQEQYSQLQQHTLSAPGGCGQALAQAVVCGGVQLEPAQAITAQAGNSERAGIWEHRFDHWRHDSVTG